MFANAKRKQQQKIRQLLCQQQRIDHIPYYPSRMSQAHFFPTTSLEIAVFINDSILMSHILGKLPNVLYHRLPVFLRMTRHGAFFLFHINASTKLIIIQFQKYLSIYSFPNIESIRWKVVLRWLGMKSKSRAAISNTTCSCPKNLTQKQFKYFFFPFNKSMQKRTYLI